MLSDDLIGEEETEEREVWSVDICLWNRENADGRLFVCCLTSQQQATCISGTDLLRHTEIEVADQTFTSPSHSILTPGRPVPALTL